MPVCKFNDITINYKVYGKGFPLVLSHGFTASLETWAPQIDDFSRNYQLIVYDARGHGFSTAPPGTENYTLELLVEDLHHLLAHLGVTKAFIGGLSMGGAIALGYAYRHSEMVAALLIFDIHGGFQPDDKAAEKIMAKMRREDREIATEHGLVDLARHKISAGTVFRPILKSESLQEEYLRRMAMMPLNGYLGISRALPWAAKWQTEAAENISVPALTVVGGDDPIKKGARILHEHIKGSCYVEIKGCVHGTAEWRPDAFNPSVLKFLEGVKSGKPVVGEVYLD